MEGYIRQGVALYAAWDAALRETEQRAAELQFWNDEYSRLEGLARRAGIMTAGSAVAAVDSVASAPGGVDLNTAKTRMNIQGEGKFAFASSALKTDGQPWQGVSFTILKVERINDPAAFFASAQ